MKWFDYAWMAIVSALMVDMILWRIKAVAFANKNVDASISVLKSLSDRIERLEATGSEVAR